jgi:anti-sigma B factor antagonist
MDLRVERRSVAGVAVVALDGVVDLATLPILQDHLSRAVQEHLGTTVAVDLDGIEAIDDCGLGLVLGAAGRARESGGDLVVVCTSPALRRRLRTTRFDRAVDVQDRLA